MTKYLKYTLQNIEPLRIADDSTSQRGQTSTLRYIPGSAVRGLIVNGLAEAEDFEEIKKALFSDKIRYLNAYLTVGERELIPSPKGFYEDKTIVDGKKEIENVVISEEFKEGHKRAALGRYCFMDKDCIHYYTVDTSSDMKIKINLKEGEKRNVFRNEYITENHMFTGYIAIDDETLAERIKGIWKETVMFGNARSAGLGKCRVLSCGYVDGLPYEEYMEDKDLKKSCYMILLSNMVMRNALGEVCGIDLKALEKKMGVQNLKMEYCSTSTVNVRGYNRIWGVKLPSVVMFEQGSVFHFSFEGELKQKAMRELAEQGIGIRRNEGFGRVLFLKEYENIKYKLSENNSKNMIKKAVKKKPGREDMETLKSAAGCYYRRKIYEKMGEFVVKNPIQKGNISSSQLGIAESFAAAFEYEPEQAKKNFESYFSNAGEKEKNHNTQKERNSIREFQKYIEYIMNTDLEQLLGIETKHPDTVMGIAKNKLLSETEKDQIRLELITAMIRYDNKKGDE